MITAQSFFTLFCDPNKYWNASPAKIVHQYCETNLHNPTKTVYLHNFSVVSSFMAVCCYAGGKTSVGLCKAGGNDTKKVK